MLGSGCTRNKSGTEYSSTCYEVKSNLMVRIMREVEKRENRERIVNVSIELLVTAYGGNAMFVLHYYTD